MFSFLVLSTLSPFQIFSFLSRLAIPVLPVEKGYTFVAMEDCVNAQNGLTPFLRIENLDVLLYNRLCQCPKRAYSFSAL